MTGKLLSFSVTQRCGKNINQWNITEVFKLNSCGEVCLFNYICCVWMPFPGCFNLKLRLASRSTRSISFSHVSPGNSGKLSKIWWNYSISNLMYHERNSIIFSRPEKAWTDSANVESIKCWIIDETLWVVRWVDLIKLWLNQKLTLRIVPKGKCQASISFQPTSTLGQGMNHISNWVFRIFYNSSI